MYYKNTTRGQVKGTTWGAMRPPERPPFGRGAGRRARVQKYRGLQFILKTNARGSPTHTKTSSELTWSVETPVPVAAWEGKIKTQQRDKL